MRLTSSGFGSADIEGIMWAASRGLDWYPGPEADSALVAVRQQLAHLRPEPLDEFLGHELDEAMAFLEAPAAAEDTVVAP